LDAVMNIFWLVLMMEPYIALAFNCLFSIIAPVVMAALVVNTR
jgi:hypothetical protein